MRTTWIAAALVMTSGIAMAQAHDGAPPTAPATPTAMKMQMPASGAAMPTGPAAEVQRNYAGVKANILKSAEKMPAESYMFKPEPDVRSFARVVEHVTEAQLHVCGAINGIAPTALPKVPAETASKAEVLEALKASFAECDKAYASVTDGNIADMISMGPVKRSRIGGLWGNASHDNEQYATLALYLRLKDIQPPSSEK